MLNDIILLVAQYLFELALKWTKMELSSLLKNYMNWNKKSTKIVN